MARFAGFGVRIAHISRHLPAAEKKQLTAAINAGEVDLVIGTHAVLSSRIKYPNLGTIVVDEEQRFGVNQKEKLKSMRVGVDVLTLTATPIPRTLQMALTGLREMSVIQTPPPSRKPVITEVHAATEKVRGAQSVPNVAGQAMRVGSASAVLCRWMMMSIIA